MLAVAPRRLALLLLATACFHDDPPPANSTDAVTTLASTTTVSPTSEGSDTSTGDGSSTGCVPITWYPDLDRVGHGDIAAPQLACTQPAGHVEVGDDCDNNDAARAPGQTVVCDDRDNDCDLIVDEFSPQNRSNRDCTPRSYASCTLARVWTDARGECMKRGRDLVVIDDGSEIDRSGRARTVGHGTLCPAP
jgi:hypothetical protein